MKLYRKEEQLCFDDILLVPNASSIESRKDIDLAMSIGEGERKVDLYLPVIAAPMDTVCEEQLATEIANHGGLGIIHRYMKPEVQTNQVLAVSKKKLKVGAAVGSVVGSKTALKHIESLIICGADVILVDTANGHSIFAVETVREIRKTFPQIHIMAGNVSTWDGFLALSLAGADSVRVGIGGGSCCTTRIVTGHGMPTLSSIIDIYEMMERMDLPTSIVADGGIRNTGDMVKSFAAGAGAVMVGSMLAGHDESPGKLVDGSYKELRGMASHNAQQDFYGGVSVVEGVAGKVPYRGSLSKTLDGIRGGISSGCSYSGVFHLEDLEYNSQYVRVSQASLGESKPHVQS